MAVSEGHEGYGAIITVSATNTSVSYSAGTAIAQVKKISGPKGKGSSIDISNMDSASARNEFFPGMWDEGEVSLELVYGKSQYTTLRSYIRAQKGFRITIPAASVGSGNAATLDFDGHFTAIGVEIPLSDGSGPCMTEATIKLSGAVTVA